MSDDKREVEVERDEASCREGESRPSDRCQGVCEQDGMREVCEMCLDLPGPLDQPTSRTSALERSRLRERRDLQKSSI